MNAASGGSRDERGAAVVELALILPILVMFVFGIVQFGNGYNARVELTAAVREGARAAALGGTTVTAADIDQKTKAAAPGLTGSLITVTSARCVGTPVPVNSTVTATYLFQYSIPFVGSRTATLTATGVMRCGG